MTITHHSSVNGDRIAHRMGTEQGMRKGIKMVEYLRF